MKTVSLDDEAYELLRGAKVTRRDSFSDVVKRHFGAGGTEWLTGTGGAWKDMSDDEVARIRQESIDQLGTT